MAPTAQLVFRSTEFESNVRTNALGFRGRVEFDRTPGVPVVAVLGDSMVEAVQVDDGDTFVEGLESGLRRERGGPVACWNLGVSSFGPPHYLATYRTFVAPKHPEVVLLTVFATNDIEDSSPTLMTIPTLRPRYAGPLESPTDVLPFDALGPPPAGQWSDAKRFLRAHSHLYRRLLWVRYGPRTSSRPGTSTQEQPSRDHAIEQAWHLAMWGIERLYAESTAAGSLTRIVVMPAMGDVTGETRGASRTPRLRQELDQRGLPYIDLSKAMSSAYRSGRQIRFLDGHLTPEGHAVAAAALLEPVANLLLAADSSCVKLGEDP